jgi:group I intron endonuclease
MNLKNNKKYIGSSKNIYHRVRKHLSELRRGIHQNHHLQSAFASDGAASFKVLILENCIESHLSDLENNWIIKEKCLCNEFGYNKSQVTDRRKNYFSIESRRKISSTLNNNKKIAKIDKLTGEIIEEYATLVDAAAYIKNQGISKSNEGFIRMKISMAARNKKVSTGLGRTAKRSSAFGYKWRYL